MIKKWTRLEVHRLINNHKQAIFVANIRYINPEVLIYYRAEAWFVENNRYNEYIITRVLKKGKKMLDIAIA